MSLGRAGRAAASVGADACDSGTSSLTHYTSNMPTKAHPLPLCSSLIQKTSGGFCLVLLLLLVVAAAGLAFVIHTQPDRAAQAAELWEAVRRHEAVGPQVRAAERRVQQLVAGNFRDEL